MGLCDRCAREITSTASRLILKMGEDKIARRVCSDCDLLERRQQHSRCVVCREAVINEEAREHPICFECHPGLVAGDVTDLDADAASRLRSLAMTVRTYERDNLERYPLVILRRRKP